MSPLTAMLLATLGVSLIALAGIPFASILLSSEAMEIRLISFAAGVLIATSLQELIPEALEMAGDDASAIGGVLVGILAFYLLEQGLEGIRSRNSERSKAGRHAANTPVFILLGDGLHNFIDGVLIAATFLVSPSAGWGAALAIAAHELPHEISDYAILVRGGFSRRRAMLANLLSGLLAVLGGLLTFYSPLDQAQLSWLVASAAGMFLYIALANLVPEAQHSRIRGIGVKAIPFAVGIALVLLLGFDSAHGH